MGLMTIAHLSVEHRLHDVSLKVKAGEVLGLIGPNGAGKSTLLSAIVGLLGYSGRIELDGVDIRSLDDSARARQIALQPQFVQSAWALSVHDVVSMGRLPWGDSDQAIICQAMRQAGVETLAQRHVDELSGGEKARVWMARVLANQPRLMLVDEPVANLDIAHQQQAMVSLAEYAAAGHAVVLAIHDLSLAAKFCDRLCLLDGGRLVEQGAVTQVLTESNLARVFGADVFVDLAGDPPVVLARGVKPL